ncbi:VOC family protein [Corynebacterium aquilae]|uniref:Glyoxalase n=1 Tax=Corynebacterium aquilae DSM 44791 TaxID=1431546 RepID=A0A1L7CD93_9CORY|nr:VOC family protein [Corynebacterium aquilae]APT83794.1 glyoxalase [Corynebacterium aquilae DSM 44791]
MPAFHAEGGMPYWIDLLTNDVAAASDFYANILGWETEQTAEGYRLARAQGLPVAGFITQPDDAPTGATWITHFLVDDIHAACDKARELGGTVTTEPTDVQLGTMALVLDPGDGFFGLIQAHSSEAFVSGGEPGTAVWHELTCTSNLEKTAGFYEELFGWTTTHTDAGDGFSYVTAMVDGAPFAGMWTGPNFPADVPNFWQTYLGVKSIDDTVAAVTSHGGRILRDPWDSEFGRLALIEDPTGGAMTICEVEEPVIEAHEGDPLHGIDLSEFQ